MATHMTVQDLRHALDGIPGDQLVILSIDGEGNEFKPLFCVETCCLYSPTHRECTAMSEMLEAQDDAVPAVALWPGH